MSSVYTIDQVLQKIAKLQRLANDAGATKAEAELAASKLQELLDKYNLSIEQIAPISEKTSDDVIFDWFRREGSRIFQWELSLLSAIARSVGCDYLYTSHIITFVGLPNDVKIAKEMFVQFRAIAQHLATKATKEYSDGFFDPRELRGVDSLKSYRLSYLLGFVAGLAETFKQAKSLEQESTALVVIKEGLIKTAIATRYPKLGKAITSNATINSRAYNTGQRDGRSGGNRKVFE